MYGWNTSTSCRSNIYHVLWLLRTAQYHVCEWLELIWSVLIVLIIQYTQPILGIEAAKWTRYSNESVQVNKLGEADCCMSIMCCALEWHIWDFVVYLIEAVASLLMELFYCFRSCSMWFAAIFSAIAELVYKTQHTFHIIIAALSASHFLYVSPGTISVDFDTIP